MTLIKSISGIRGTIGGKPGENLTPIDLVKFTSAYAQWLKGEFPGKKLKVVIGRDARLSGEMAASIVEGTLCGCGVDVINIGLATTPTVEVAVTGKQADGGIILTASHNPRQWNALKLLNSRGEFLSDAEGKKVLALAEAGIETYPEIDAIGHVIEHSSYNDKHIKAALALKLADLGIVVDPDVDRLALICEDGSMFGEEYTLVSVADYVLSHTQGATVSNLSSSRALRDITEKHGCKYSAAAVGEVNVVTKMKEVGAVIGGEGNGGVIYPELHYGRDALVGVVLFLTLLAKSGLKASQLRATYPAYHISKNKIELTPDIDVDKVLAQMKAKYAGEQVTDIDGVKIDFPTQWVHLRKSNTEPIIRIYSESADKASADALAEKIISEIREIVAK